MVEVESLYREAPSLIAMQYYILSVHIVYYSNEVILPYLRLLRQDGEKDFIFMNGNKKSHRVKIIVIFWNKMVFLKCNGHRSHMRIFRML